MEWWQALILGIVEGVTEFLPVSSTGHLILAQNALGMPSDDAHKAYAIAIQGGAILAVVWLYFNRVKQMSLGLLGRSPAGMRLAVNVVAAFVPTAVAALLLEKRIKANLEGLWPIVIAWFVGGVIILMLAGRRSASSHSRPGLESLSWRGAAAIGVIQCLGMWPGTSRSLIVIVGGLVVGLNLAAAIEFSFLLGVLTLLAATAYELLKHREAMTAALGVAPMLIGAVAAGISAAAAVQWMVGYLNRHGMAIFGYYRVGLAVVVGGLILGGQLDARAGAAHARGQDAAVARPATIAPASDALVGAPASTIVPPAPAPMTPPAPAPMTPPAPAPAAAPRSTPRR